MPYPVAAARGKGNPAQGAFQVPTDLSGLALWLDADYGTYADAARLTPATVDQDFIGGWEDRSGLGNHGSNAEGIFRPSLRLNQINGHAALRFDGSNDRFDCGTGIDLTACTVFVVCKNSNITGLSATFDVSDPAGPTDNFTQLWDSQAADKWFAQWYNGGFTNINGEVTFGNTWLYRTDRHDGAAGNVEVWKNGVSVLTGTGKAALVTAAANHTYIGYYAVGSTGWLEGDIAEVIVYSRALAAGELASVHGYLAARYGL